jgi:hypothetical protein
MTESGLMNNPADNKKAGLVLIVGSLCAIVTMAIHPTGQSAHLMIISPIAHILALISVLLLFMGAFGLYRFLAAPDRLAFAALVVFGLAVVAVSIAGTVSGFIMPTLIQRMSHDTPTTMPQWHIVIAAIFQINQAFSSVYTVGAAVAISLWSVCCLRLSRLSRGFALYGCITAPLIALVVMVGHLRLDIHGMTVVVLSQAIWFVGMGFALRKNNMTPAS